MITFVSTKYENLPGAGDPNRPPGFGAAAGAPNRPGAGALLFLVEVNVGERKQPRQRRWI